MLAQGRFGSERQGAFEIVRLLPEEHGIHQYRLKSMQDGRERVAMEEELSKLV
jgi:FAD synthase